MQIRRQLTRYFSDLRPDEARHRQSEMAEDPGPEASDPGDIGSLPTGSDELEADSTSGKADGVEEMEDERLQILRMVEEHKITADEGVKLLAALDRTSKPADQPAATRPRWLRIRATDMATGRTKVNVTIPIGFVLAAGNLAARAGIARLAGTEGFDVEELMQAIRSGVEGKLVDVTPDDGGDHVEVFVE